MSSGEDTRPARETSHLSVATTLAFELRELVAQLVSASVRVAMTSSPVPILGPRVPDHRWMTPPAASRVTGVPVKAIRSYIRDRRIEARLRNKDAMPKQRKYLVDADEVARVATVSVGMSPPPGMMNAMTDSRLPTTPDDWVKARLAATPGR